MTLPLVKNSKGFTLVELLVVTVIMGLVMTAVYGLFIDNKKTSATSEEVIDVQQNLRVALNFMVEDIRMAGFLIPVAATPITSAPDVIRIDANRDGVVDGGDSGAFFSMQTGSSKKVYARVLGEEYSAPTLKLLVSDDIIDQFSIGDVIKVIQPATLEVLNPGTWAISAVDPLNNKLSVTDNTYVAGTILLGDMIAFKRTGEATPAFISYWLQPTLNAGTNNFELVRSDGNNTSVVARNVLTLDMTYLMDDGTESVAPADLTGITAIRLTITAETDNTKTGLAGYSGVKRRRLQTLVKIRNAQGG